jgi:hypothetical protein
MTCKHLASYHVIQLPVVRDDQVRFAYGILCTVDDLIARSLAVLSSFDNTVHLSQSPRCYSSSRLLRQSFPDEWCDCTATDISIHPKEAKSDDLQPSLITLIGSSTLHCSFPSLDSTAGFDDFLE